MIIAPNPHNFQGEGNASAVLQIREQSQGSWEIGLEFISRAGDPSVLLACPRWELRGESRWGPGQTFSVASGSWAWFSGHMAILVVIRSTVIVYMVNGW